VMVVVRALPPRNDRIGHGSHAQLPADSSRLNLNAC
jgi:hypothetical protein